jgi:hypothetical protein
MCGQGRIGRRRDLGTQLGVLIGRDRQRRSARSWTWAQIAGLATILQPALQAGQADLEGGDNIVAGHPSVEGGQHPHAQIDGIGLHSA